MSKIISAKGGSASGGKNIDSVNRDPAVRSKTIPQRQPAAALNQVNLLSLNKKPTGKKILKRILVTIAGLIVILGLIVISRAANLSDKIFVGQKTTFLGKIFNLIRGDGDHQRLIGEDLGQINILLLGIGGEGHDGPYLTDTMILAQIRPDIGEITLTSIPRDYLVDLPNNGGQEKINSAFSYGFTKNNHDWDQAGSWARQVVEQISGLKVPYFAVVDFSGFEQAVNKVGGLDVNVERTFTDYQYPDSGTGYLPPQTFTAGPTHLDGAKALIFARSRHAEGLEGSDFARGLRQQKIIEAFKQKALSLNLIKDGGALNDLLNIFADHFHTNMTPNGLFRAYSLLKDKGMQTLSLSLDLDSHLVCPEILASNGAYVLVPCRSADDIKNFFKNSFSVGKLTQEKATVWLASSTGNKAAYDTAYRALTDAGIIVYNLAYSKDQLPQTLVYQVNPKPATAEFIQNELKATGVDLAPPGVTVKADKVDVIVVLGQNAPITPPPAPYIAPPARVATSTADIATSTPATSTPSKLIKK